VGHPLAVTVALVSRSGRAAEVEPLPTRVAARGRRRSILRTSEVEVVSTVRYIMVGTSRRSESSQLCTTPAALPPARRERPHPPQQGSALSRHPAHPTIEHGGRDPQPKSTLQVFEPLPIVVSGKSLANDGAALSGHATNGEIKPGLGCWSVVEPPGGIEPATPSLP
jgi:hypothetical protein